MGLGKTVMTIALILARPGRRSSGVHKLLTEAADDTEEAEKNTDSHTKAPLNVKGGTLIVCPMALLSQWKVRSCFCEGKKNSEILTLLDSKLWNATMLLFFKKYFIKFNNTSGWAGNTFKARKYFYFYPLWWRQNQWPKGDIRTWCGLDNIRCLNFSL